MHRIPVAALTIAILFGTSAGASGNDERREANTNGRVHGYVRDAAGTAIADASVLAIGMTVVSARSDKSGRFQLALPAGQYVLRATRAGYLSTYREPVKVERAILLERVITLFRQAAGASEAEKIADSHAHTELAWQLRHLPRSVLRDGAATTEWTSASSQQPAPSGSLFWRAIDTSKRMASRIGTTDFSGQVNFVTTASADPSSFVVTTLPRSVAYVVFGAPVGTVGDWRVRGAIGSGTDAAWNVLGEYEAHRSEAHALRFGVSYSAHAPKVTGAMQVSRAALEARSVAGMFAEDRWRLLDHIELEYAVRANRYDFLTSPYLLSASGGLRARVLPATYMTLRAGRSMLAPGAEEFLPPPADGPWLPPERTFTPLVARDLMRAETVRHVEVGFARDFGERRRHRIQARAFQQFTTDQIATLFSTQAAASSGQYRVARSGDVTVSGWTAGFSSSLTPFLSATIEYSRMATDWNSTSRTRGLRRVAPSAVRDTDEWLDDVTATVQASFNQARTRLVAYYRANTAFTQTRGAAGLGSRFDIQFHQALHARPNSDNRLELFFSVRNLFRDPSAGSSPYDELLTFSPPLRFMGGIQVRF